MEDSKRQTLRSELEFSKKAGSVKRRKKKIKIPGRAREPPLKRKDFGIHFGGGMWPRLCKRQILAGRKSISSKKKGEKNISRLPKEEHRTACLNVRGKGG